jgi:hypothetical protein
MALNIELPADGGGKGKGFSWAGKMECVCTHGVKCHQDSVIKTVQMS